MKFFRAKIRLWPLIVAPVVLIAGLERADADGDLFGIAGLKIPGSERLTYIEYEFDAKLGIDGAAVEITPTDENTYTVSIPEFIFIGHANEHFGDAIQSNGILSNWFSDEISETDMVNNILSAEKKDEYVSNSLQILKDQAEAFYGGIIRSVDASAVLEFEFAE